MKTKSKKSSKDLFHQPPPPDTERKKLMEKQRLERCNKVHELSKTLKDASYEKAETESQL